MAIKRTTASSTHSGNGGDKIKIEQGDVELQNNMSADVLIDPEDNTGGSTHSSKPVKVKASADDFSDLDDSGELSDDTSDEEVDATGDDLDDLLKDDSPEDEAPAAEGFDVTGADEADWDAPPPPVDESDDFIEDSDEETMETADSTIDPDLDADSGADVEPSGGNMSLLDIDGVEDGDVSQVAFASFGTNLMVIKSDRIVATMNKRIAAALNKADVYLTDQFQEVTAAEMNKVGLRAGLKSMGFVLAKVDISKQSVIAAQVKQETTKATASLRKVTASKEAAFQRSLAIASVGINRQFFKNQPNELKAALEAELTAAGVRNPNRILTRAFASAGPAYAKAIVTIANKLAEMPDETRDAYVEALDMTGNEMDPVEDFQDEVVGSDDDEFMDDDNEVMPVVASLSSPGHVNRKVTASTTGYSVTANAILNGDQPLFNL